MFDETPDTLSQSNPANAVDPFEDMDHIESMGDLSPETTPMGPSALEAGKVQPVPSMAASMQPDFSENEMHEPTALKRILIATAIIVLLGGGGVFAWWYFTNANAPAPAANTSVVPADTAQPTPTDMVNIDVTGPAVAATTTSAAQFQPSSSPTISTSTAAIPAADENTTSTTAVDTNIDTDHDGLTDAEEAKYSTDSKNPDTDGDGLNDGVEVHIWFTGPLKKDTDGDGYSDGMEVLSGYNPRGPGKLH